MILYFIDWALDLIGTALRECEQPNLVGVLMFNQGFHSLVAYRVGNWLWYNGSPGLAKFFQSLVSREYGSDIHPACYIGYGCCIGDW